MKTNLNTLLYLLYLITLVTAFIFSFTQIDLNLTLSSLPLYQILQRRLTYLGYFNRGFTSVFFSVILFSLYLYYFLFLIMVKLRKLNTRDIILLTLAAAIIFSLSYPALSHDLFNYVFDARIVTKYSQNPYFYKAADFPDDLWVRFMHWTHRTYPYGPLWILTTIPFSALGFGKFLLTIYNFKLMFLLLHLGNIFLIYKISELLQPNMSNFSVTFYALNPLILIESLMSPHNEVLAVLFLLLSIYFLLVKLSKITSVISIVLSFLVKYTTILFIPLVIFYSIGKRKLSAINFLKQTILLTMISIVILSLYREPYPWYFLPLIAINSLTLKNIYLTVLNIVISLGALLRYLPFILYGDYSLKVINYQNIIFFSLLLSVSIFLLFHKTLTNHPNKQSC